MITFNGCIVKAEVNMTMPQSTRLILVIQILDGTTIDSLDAFPRSVQQFTISDIPRATPQLVLRKSPEKDDGFL